HQSSSQQPSCLRTAASNLSKARHFIYQQEICMRAKGILPVLASVLLAFAIGCNTNKAATPDVKDQVSHALGNAGFKDIKVNTDNDKQLVTLSGDVKTQEDKERAEDVAK